jgi:hypothetical protein
MPAAVNHRLLSGLIALQVDPIVRRAAHRARRGRRRSRHDEAAPHQWSEDLSRTA